ncbi:MAG: hypothetical protein ACI8RD_007342, partial [Bacillariaceae sp.]
YTVPSCDAIAILFTLAFHDVQLVVVFLSEFFKLPERAKSGRAKQKLRI